MRRSRKRRGGVRITGFPPKNGGDGKLVSQRSRKSPPSGIGVRISSPPPTDSLASFVTMPGMGHTPESRKRAYDKMKRLRAAWLTENGPCKRCGSSYRLQVDHVNPATKIHHAVWTWREDRRLLELAKCQVLCGPCHWEKHAPKGMVSRQRKIGPVGTAWCVSHQRFLTVGLFSKDRVRWNGVQSQCVECRSKARSPGRMSARVAKTVKAQACKA